MIQVHFHQEEIEECSSVIVIPNTAIDEPGYVQTMAAKNTVFSKHEFHAIAQMAYFQFQDDELNITVVRGNIRIENGDHCEILKEGMLLCRRIDSGFSTLVHEGLSTKKLLEVSYRYCTRWVRLDI